MGKRWILIPPLLLASGTSLAAEQAAERAQRCARIADSLERLVCYDRIFAPATSASTPVEPPAVRSQPAPAPPAAPPAAGPREAPASTASSAPARDASADFGADQLRRSPSRDEDEAAPRTLTATIQSLRETRPNVFRMELDNGQVWQQMDMDSLFHVREGDTVEINRGRLGGYRMARTSRGGSGWVRVNRVK